MSTTLETTALTNKDIKTTKGWKKLYGLTMTGMLNGVTITLILKSENLELLEDIAEFDIKTQRGIRIEHVNHTLSSYPGSPGIAAAQSSQSSLSQEEQDEQDQKETLEELRRQLYAVKEQADNEP